MYIYKNFISDKKSDSGNAAMVEYGKINNQPIIPLPQSIDQLTEEKIVAAYVKQNHKLPEYYVTKNEARRQGWDPSEGNLCEVLPGRAIGGDRFGNRERNLPKDEIYYEADVNYHCGTRNADRIVFTGNGKVYLTKNHYKNFVEQ